MTHGFFITMGGFHLFGRSSVETSNDNRRISRENNEPFHPRRAIFGGVTVTSHPSCWPRWESRTRGRVAGSLNTSSCSKRRGSWSSALHGASNTFQSPEQTTQRQSACLSVPEILAGPGRCRTDLKMRGNWSGKQSTKAWKYLLQVFRIWMST